MVRDIRLYLILRFCGALAMQVQIVAIGWQVYAISHDPFALGFVGLSQFLAMLTFVLPAGDVADRIDRRRILFFVYALQCVASALLLYFSIAGEHTLWPYYVVAALFGLAQAFAGPAMQSLLPFLVTPDVLPRAVAWGSSMWQIATIAGPAVGGVLLIVGPSAAYAIALLLFLICTVGATQLVLRRIAVVAASGTTFERVAEGIRFVWSKKIVLGAISLDLFAVLFGGATALLPIYARDILQVGEWGFGFMRSAPAVGATIVAFILTRHQLSRHVGVKMFGCVAVFGVATVVFGLSQNFALSLVALAFLGAADQISVVVRSTLTQLATPDAVRGRVSAVNFLFIGTSNELGEFESGTLAGFIGAVPAVVVGGIGTLIVVGLWLKLFPSLRRIDRFSDAMAHEISSPVYGGSAREAGEGGSLTPSLAPPSGPLRSPPPP